MDVVYVVGSQTDELRYSIRSLRHVEHDRVWVAGAKPKHLKVEHIPTRERYSKKGLNILNALLTAAEHPEVSDQFIYFNDDFFALRPTTVPVWHKGETQPEKPVRHRDMSWRESCAATAWVLDKWGFGIVNYEMHVPIIFDKQKLAEVIRRAYATHVHGLQARSLYGNVHSIGGTKHADVKIKSDEKAWPSGSAWVSTNNHSFTKGLVGKKLREKFPEPSPYEEA